MPIFHREKGKLEKAVDESVFKSILNVVRALADQDERLEEEIRNIKLGKGEREGRKINLGEIDDSINISFFELPGNLGSLLFDQIIEKTRIPWRNFEEAREFVRSLGLKSANEWRKYLNGEFKKKPSKPDDIPTEPNSTYKEKGWKNWGDWLGTGEIATFLREYQDFKEARNFARPLELNSFKEWLKFVRGEIKGKHKKPDNIPSNPNVVYKDHGWQGWQDWLGTLKEYRSLKKARKFAKSLELNSGREWQQFVRGKVKGKHKKPDDIPAYPQMVYKNKGWQSWDDWLGKKTTPWGRYKSFKEARKFVRPLELQSCKDWSRYIRGETKGKPKKPDDIPAKPDRIYKNYGWENWGDWLGTGNIAYSLRKNRIFKEARKFTRTLGLKSSKEWKQFINGKIKKKIKRPNDIPKNPAGAYRDKGWQGWGDWLGTGRVADHLRIYRPFKKARKFASSLGLKSQKDWFLYVKGEIKRKPKKPNDVPSNPNNTYKNKGWKGWGDWLGTGRIAQHLREYKPFKQARKFARSLALKSGTEWYKYTRGEIKGKPQKPDDIPAYPSQTYEDKGWQGMGDWLGK